MAKRELVRDQPRLYINLSADLKAEAELVAERHFNNSKMDYVRWLIRQDVRRRAKFGASFPVIDSILDRIPADKIEVALLTAAGRIK